jgi:ubiquinol-cytochrome c reductase cytochrome c1 subunit
MIKTSTIFAAALIGLGLAALPALAQEAAPTEPVVKQHWSFAGPFGTFDKNQLQRGFQVFETVCSSCHSAHLLSFRNLSEPGGPEFSEAQVKALAATYQIVDPSADGGTRPGLSSDRWPDPFASEQEARDSNGGALPPDMSVLAKARSVEDHFPNWVFNYFTTYAEGGPDYIHALLNGYLEEPPAGVEMQPGKYYNKVFPGHAISMPPPLSDGQVPYGEAADATTVPLTVDQYSRDAAAFLMWMAEPHLNENKAAGFRVLSFLLLFAVLMYFVKQRVWRKVEH